MNHDITINGLTFRCRIDGPTTGAPWLVFSNALLTTLALWDRQVGILRRDFRILRYDQRGHGGTQVPDGPTNFRQLGADVEALLDHFGIESCTFVGLSMGVPTGLQLMRTNPSRIDRLVLCDGVTRTQPGAAQGWQNRIDAARRDGMAAFARATADRWFAAATRQQAGAQAVERMIADTPLEGFIACARALQDYDFDDGLETIAVPTLLLPGDADGGIPGIMAALADRIPRGRFGLIPAAGHISNIENPEGFNRLLLPFLHDA